MTLARAASQARDYDYRVVRVDFFQAFGQPPQPGDAAILKHGVGDAQIAQGARGFPSYESIRRTGGYDGDATFGFGRQAVS